MPNESRNVLQVKRGVWNASHLIADVALAAIFAFIGYLTGGDPGFDALIAFVLGVVIFRAISIRRVLINVR